MVKKLARHGIASKRSITYTILGLFYETMTYKPPFHAYSSTVDSFVILSLFLEKHYIPPRSIIID